jgi:AcrR family transcriptional regulator
MRRKTTKGFRTRAAILETAFDLFGRQGYHATTVRQIAEQSNLTPGSIYNHFSGKDDVFLNVLSNYHPLNQISPLLVEVKGSTPEQYIRRLAEAIGRVLEDQSGLLNLTFIEMVELDGRHLPALVEQFQPQVMAFAQRLHSEPDRLQVPPLKAFRVFLGLLLAHELTDRLVETALGDRGVDPGSLEGFVDVYLHGILKPKQGGEHQDEHE